MDKKAFPSILLLSVLWGTNLVVSRFGVGQFAPVLFAGLRLSLATLGFGVIFLVSRRSWPRDRRLWHHASLLGLFGTAVPMTLTMSSLTYQSSGVTALLLTTTPAIVVLMAHLFLPDERLNWYKGSGVILALSGAFLLIIRGESGLPDIRQASPIGYFLVLAGMISESAMAIYVRTRMRGLDALEVTGVRLLTATLLVLPLALVLPGANLSRVNNYGLYALAYAAFAGALAGQLMAFHVTKKFGATAFSMTAYIIPLVAVVIGVTLLDEKISSGMLAGMALIVVGIGLINRHT